MLMLISHVSLADFHLVSFHLQWKWKLSIRRRMREREEERGFARGFVLQK